MDLFKNEPQTTATGTSGTTSPVSGTSESWTVTSSSSFPAVITASGNTFHIADPALPSEIIAVTNVSGTTWTVTRGAEGTTPVAHSTGATYKQVVTAAVLNSLFQAQFVLPSGDATGATDITNLNAAFTALPNGGIVWLAPGTYYIGAAGISVPPYITLWGSGHNTVINCVGAGTGTYILQYNSADPTTYTRLSGCLRDFVVDGTSAGNGAIGVQLQDMNGSDIRIGVRNFTGTGSIGVQMANNTHSMNNITGYCRIENCTNCLTFTTLGAQNAIEHIYVVWDMTVFAGQNAVVLSASVGVQGSQFTADVGVRSTTAGPMFTFGTGCVFSNTMFLYKAELASGSGTASTVSFNGGGSGFVNTTGILFFGSNLANSNINTAGGQVKHFGTIIGDSTMQANAVAPDNTGTYDQASISAPAFPGASGTAVNNGTGLPAWVTVAGGTLSAATQINGVNVGDTSTRVFMVPRGQTIKLTWSAAPTGWVWQPVG